MEDIKPLDLKLRSDVHLARKIWHMCSGLIGLAIYLYFQIPSDLLAKGLIALGVVGFIGENIRIRVPSVNQLFLRYFAFVMRAQEAHNISGMPYYALGAGLSLILYSNDVAIMSVLFLIFSDPVSSLVGIIYGTEKLVEGKSLQGSVAGLMCCYTITLAYGIQQGLHGLNLYIFAILAGIIGMVSELFSHYIDDNLTIPLASGAGLTLLNQFIPIF